MKSFSTADLTQISSGTAYGLTGIPVLCCSCWRSTYRTNCLHKLARSVCDHVQFSLTQRIRIDQYGPSGHSGCSSSNEFSRRLKVYAARRHCIDLRERAFEGLDVLW